MTPAQITAWIQVSQLLLAADVPVFNFLHGLLQKSHPSLTPEQVNAAYVAILSDDALRETFAQRAGTPS